MRPCRSQMVVLSLLPFLLLSSARTTSLRTTVYLDGTVRRELQADFLEDRRGDVLPEMENALPNADRQSIVSMGDGRQATRSVILADPDDLDGATLEWQDIAQDPFSLTTTYTWKETLRVPSDTATLVEKVGLSQAKFQYKLTLPGNIEDATAVPQKATAKSQVQSPKSQVAETTPAPAPETTPPAAAPAPVAPEATATPEAAAVPATPEATATPAPAAPAAPAPAPTEEPPPAPGGGSASLAPDIVGSTALFTLTAGHDQYQITATSQRIRWGYLLTLLYILGFLAYRITAFLVHRANLKPKRI